jgi:hypothetical protein
VKNTRLSSLIPKNVHPVQAEIFFLLEVPAMFISAPVNRTKCNLNKKQWAANDSGCRPLPHQLTSEEVSGSAVERFTFTHYARSFLSQISNLHFKHSLLRH